MKSLWDLMLKGTEYEDILHEDAWPVCEDELIRCLDGLDFVVKAWLESMEGFEIDNADEIATSVYMAIMECRFAIISYLTAEEECPDLTDDVQYLEVLKTIRHLKQAFMALSKSYAQTKILAKWYLNLPIRIQAGFKSVHAIRVNNQNKYGGSTYPPYDEGAIHK